MASNSDLILEKQIDDLSNVEISPDLIDRLDIKKLSDKATEIINALNESESNLEDLISQGRFTSFFSSVSGKNDKILANAEKSVVDSSIFNVGLSCLLVLFSKAIKQQQDLIVDQQKTLQTQQNKLEQQGNDILKIQGLTKEQADKIVQLLETDEYVKKQIEKIKAGITNELSEHKRLLSQKIERIEDDFSNRSKNIDHEIARLLEADEYVKKKIESVQDEISNELSEHKTLSSQKVKEVEDYFSDLTENIDHRLDKKTGELDETSIKQAERIEKLELGTSKLNSYVRWLSAGSVLIVFILLIIIYSII